MNIDVLKQSIFGNTIVDYLISLSIVLAGFITIHIAARFIMPRISRLAQKTETTLDDLVISAFRQKLFPLFYVGILYLALKGISLTSALSKTIDVITLILVIFSCVRFLLEIFNHILELYWVRREKNSDKKQALQGIQMVLKLIIWTVATVILLDNFGIKISALVAGLGIGGIAIALAAQAILGDLFSYFTIFFDRPFEIGDFIITGDYLGVIEHIGIKTTRIRSLSGEQLIFSNTDLTNSRVRNYKRMGKRRVVFKLGVTYSTNTETVREIPVIITEIIKGVKDTAFDRAHFFEFADFSLVFEVVYYVIGSDYNKYMDIQQEINVKIKQAFEKKKIEFAFPTQTLYIQK